MGNDGGSIPTRRELVKEGAKSLTTTQLKEIQNEKQEHYWATCALSHEPLTRPIVSDGLGTLYNKAAVLDHLLKLAENGADLDTLTKRGEAYKDRIRSLKDVVEVKFEVMDKPTSRSLSFVCPITNKTLGPGVKAIYLVPCGHAFAESVVRETEGANCLQCNETYSEENIIAILPTSEAEKDRLEQRMIDLKSRGLSHSLKKASGGGKKRKKPGAENGVAPIDGRSEQALKQETQAIRNADTATLTTKVLAEQDDRNKRRKANANDNVKSLFTDSKGKNINDFMNRGFTIPAGAKHS